MDQEDPEAVAAYEKRRGTKHGILKVPFVLGNLWRKVRARWGARAGGGGRRRCCLRYCHCFCCGLMARGSAPAAPTAAQTPARMLPACPTGDRFRQEGAAAGGGSSRARRGAGSSARGRLCRHLSPAESCIAVCNGCGSAADHLVFTRFHPCRACPLPACTFIRMNLLGPTTHEAAALAARL